MLTCKTLVQTHALLQAEQLPTWLPKWFTWDHKNILLHGVTPLAKRKVLLFPLSPVKKVPKVFLYSVEREGDASMG